jgi:hypothetical protein
MKTYILSVMSKEEINQHKCIEIKKFLKSIYPEYRIEYSQYNYTDRKYKEVDFDIQGIVFHKETITEELNQLIKAITIIFDYIDVDCEVIGGYNDTENAIMQYELDREKNYINFGLFGTKSIMPNGNPYYESNGIYIYQSFKYDSMGVIFQ